MQAPSQGQEDPLEEGMEPTAVFLPEELYGQRRMAGDSPEVCKESSMTEAPEHHMHTYVYKYTFYSGMKNNAVGLPW